MKQLAALVLAIIISALSGFSLGVYCALHKPSSVKTSEVTTTQKSGAPVSVSGWDVSDDSFRFTTTAEGEGVSETTAPKSIIPEAKAYMQRVHQVNGIIGVLLYDRKTDPFAGGEYLYRYMNFSAGGGMLISSHGMFGIYGKTGWMF